MKKLSINLFIILLLVLTTGFYSGNSFAGAAATSVGIADQVRNDTSTIATSVEIPGQARNDKSTATATPTTATPAPVTTDTPIVDIAENTAVDLVLTSDTILTSSSGKNQIDIGGKYISIESETEDYINITLRGDINLKGGLINGGVIEINANVNLFLEEGSETTLTSVKSGCSAYGIRVYEGKTLKIDGGGKLNIDVALATDAYYCAYGIGVEGWWDYGGSTTTIEINGGYFDIDVDAHYDSNVAIGIGIGMVSYDCTFNLIINGGSFDIDIEGDTDATGIGTKYCYSTDNIHLTINDGDFDIDTMSDGYAIGIGVYGVYADGSYIIINDGNFDIDVSGRSDTVAIGVLSSSVPIQLRAGTFDINANSSEGDRVVGIGFAEVSSSSNIYIGCNSAHEDVNPDKDLQIKVAVDGPFYAAGIGFGYITGSSEYEIYLYRGDIQASVNGTGYGIGNGSSSSGTTAEIKVDDNLREDCTFKAGNSIEEFDEIKTEGDGLPSEVTSGTASLFNNKAIIIVQTHITGIEIIGAPATVGLPLTSETVQLSASITPENAFFKDLKWESSDSAIATVSTIGLVTFTGEEGEVTFTAAARDGSGVSDTKTVVVSEEVKVSSISLSGSGTYLYKAKGGNSLQLEPVILPSNATNKQVGYKSSKTTIATVNSAGLVKFKGKEGTVTITATAKDGSGKAAKKKITVCKNITAIKVPLAKLYVTKGKKVNLNVVLEDNTDKTKSVTGKVTYTSSNKKSLTVDSKGNIKAKKKEKKTVTVAIKAANGKTLKVKVYIVKGTKKIKSLKVTAPKKLKKGNVYHLTLKPNASSATNLSVAFKSNKKSILSVTKSGKLVAHKKGKAKITVTVSGKKMTKTVTVV